MKNPLEESVYSKRIISKNNEIRGDYFRDQTAIIHSMPFRRLKHKTQVFFSPENDHVCTRIEHVMHVATIGASICKGLNKNNNWDLNIEMAYAIGLGHDLGHAPFGHAGETALNRRLGKGQKFYHEMNSYRVVTKLANGGKGLNLTYGVKDGIINHNGESLVQYLEPSKTINNLDEIKNRTFVASSYEGVIIRYSDVIAYLGRDIEDAILAGFIKMSDVPKDIRKNLGNTNGEMINSFIIDLIKNSKNSERIGFSDKVFEEIDALKKFNYKYIYAHEDIMQYKEKGEKILEELFDYLVYLYSNNGQNYEKYKEENNLLGHSFGNYIEKMKKHYESENNIGTSLVCDYISGMTDNYALKAYKSIKLPSAIGFNKL